MLRRLRTGGWLLLVGLMACSSLRPELRENQGAVCALSAEGENWQGAQTFEVDAPVSVLYVLDECLSSSCDRDRSASCTVAREGEVIQVDTRAAWTADRSGPCTDDCGRLTASCTTPPLPAGTYTLRSGEQEVAFTVPSQVDRAPCTVDPSW